MIPIHAMGSRSCLIHIDQDMHIQFDQYIPLVLDSSDEWFRTLWLSFENASLIRKVLYCYYKQIKINDFRIIVYNETEILKSDQLQYHLLINEQLKGEVAQVREININKTQIAPIIFQINNTLSLNPAINLFANEVSFHNRFHGNSWKPTEQPMEGFWIITSSCKQLDSLLLFSGETWGQVSGKLGKLRLPSCNKGSTMKSMYVLAWHECWLREDEIANMYIPYQCAISNFESSMNHSKSLRTLYTQCDVRYLGSRLMKLIYVEFWANWS